MNTKKRWKIVAHILGLDGIWFYRAKIIQYEVRPTALTFAEAQEFLTKDGGSTINWNVGGFEERSSADGMLGSLVRSERGDDKSIVIEQGVTRFVINVEKQEIKTCL